MAAIIPAPTFNGTNLNTNTAMDFVWKFERYCLLQGHANNQWTFLFNALIDIPARISYDAALGGHGIRADIDMAGLAAGPAAAEANARYVARRNWLLATYNSQEQQDAAKDIIEHMHQGINEDPHTYYQCILTQVN